MAGLFLNDIQGNILRGYNFGSGSHYFVGLPDPESGRALLRDLLPEITTARMWTSRPAIALNVALTFAGLKVLGVDKATLDELPDAFTQPIRDRAPRLLGDKLEDWEPWIGQPQVHMLVLLTSSEPRLQGRSLDQRFPQLADAGEWLRLRLDAHGAACIHRQDVETLPDSQREHFGFADGLGQPAIEGMPNNVPGQGIPEPETGAWRDIKVGEFILGYSNEDGEPLPERPTWLLYDGSYMVYRKLEQNVRLFRNLMYLQGTAYAAAQLPAPVSDQAAFELMAAKVAGRWRDGKALELHPGPRDEDLRLKRHIQIDNNFRYGPDQDGAICPVGAHVRRANPRDLLGRDGQESGRHRIIRRSMPYGPPFGGWDDDMSEAGSCAGEAACGAEKGTRGLIFMCFNADLARQFEVVQGQWCDDGNVFGLGDDQDYLLGSDTEGKLTVEGKPPFFATRGCRVVITRGCEYLLMPGLTALERLAAPWSLASDLERVPAKEPAAAFRATELVCEQMQNDYARSRPALRGLHPKPHACLKARFSVEDVPEDLRVGLFETERMYDAWIRFSASHSPVRSDARADAHGMAIKVVDVGGEKVLPWERWLRTQDFIMVNHDNFFLRDAVQVAEFARAITPMGPVPLRGVEAQLRLANFFFPIDPRRRWKPRSAGTLFNTVMKPVENPLGIRYWSQTPYSFGDRAVKFSARPAGSSPPPASQPRDWNALEEAIRGALEAPDAEYSFDFLVQCQVDASTMPIEDPTVPWNERDSAFRKVATIYIDRQHFVDQHRLNRGENLVFTPWHALGDHRPLGGINRVRRVAYRASSDLRHELNAAPQREPGGRITPRPAGMMDFVAAASISRWYDLARAATGSAAPSPPASSAPGDAEAPPR